MSEDKLPVVQLKDLFNNTEQPIKLNKIEGVKSKEELEAELVAGITINFLDRVRYHAVKAIEWTWYAVGKTVELAIAIPQALKDGKQMALYAAIAVVGILILVVLYFVMR